MTAGLPQSGISLVAENAGKFLTDTAKSGKAVQEFAADSVAAATKVTAAGAKMGAAAKGAADLWQDAQGRWRTASGKFATDADKAAAGMEVIPKAAKKAAQETGMAFNGVGDMIKRAMSGVGDVVKNAFKGIGNAINEVVVGALRRVGELITDAMVQAGRAVAGFMKDSISAAGDFEQTLNVLGATSGATAAELDAVGQKAKELGADMTLPATSAQDAAEVMLELSKAGLSVAESMDAAKGALQLSAAAQVDAATAAQIMSGALNAFGLEATDAIRVADLLAAGANASSASITDLSAGLQQAGFAFNAAGLPVEDLVTSLAALTNVGLTGSDAGTALKNALMRLMDPTDKAAKLMDSLGFSAYDAQGNMKQLPQIIADLNTAMAGMTQEQRNATLGNIFLSDGMKAMIPLLDLGTDGFLSLKTSVTEQGAAATVAGAQMQGWNGAMAAASSQLETLQLVIGQRLLPLLTPLGFRVAELIGSFTGLFETFMKMLPTIQAAESPFNALLNAFIILNPSLIGAVRLISQLADVITPLIAGFTGANTGAYGVANALMTVLRPLGATSGSVVTATEALFQIWGALQQVAGILAGQFTGSVGGAQATTATLVNFLLGTLLPAIATAATWFATNLPAAIQIAQTKFGELQAWIASVMPAIQGIITSVLTIIQGLWAKHGQDVLTIVSGLWQAISGVIQVVFGIIQGMLAIFAASMTGDYTTMMQQIDQANTTIWTGISNFLKGILNIIAGFFGTSLKEINDTWKYNFQQMARIAGVLMEQAKSAIQPAIAAISGAFNGITGAINGAIQAVKNFIAAAARIVVPKLVTPGSPTPLETGLRGIAAGATVAKDAIKSLFAEGGGGGIGDALNDLVDQASGKSKDKKRESGGDGGGAAAVGKAVSSSMEPIISDYQMMLNRLVASLGGTVSGTPQMQPPVIVQGGNTTVTQSRTYAPNYGGAVTPCPTVDLAIDRSQAQW